MSVVSFLLTTKIPEVDAERQTQSPLQNCPNYTIEWVTECGPNQLQTFKLMKQDAIKLKK